MKKTIYSDKMEINADNHDWLANILHDQMFKFFLKKCTLEDRCIILSKSYGYDNHDIGVIQGYSEKTIKRRLDKLEIIYQRFING